MFEWTTNSFLLHVEIVDDDANEEVECEERTEDDEEDEVEVHEVTSVSLWLLTSLNVIQQNNTKISSVTYHRIIHRVRKKTPAP